MVSDKCIRTGKSIKTEKNKVAIVQSSQRLTKEAAVEQGFNQKLE
jgi:predicted nuclease of restriction endonuclease-like (RecB) superfamily